MTVRQSVNARTLGKRFAEIVCERNLPVQEIRVRDGAEHPEIWVTTKPLEILQMRPVYQARVALRQSFPDAEYVMNIVNPEWARASSLDDYLPQDAQKIECGA